MINRPAEAHEIGRLQEIEKSARTRYRSIDELSFAADSPAIAAHRPIEGSLTVAEEDGHPVGVILMNSMDGALYIANVSVAPLFSGRGIGGALIMAAQDRTRLLGLRALTLTTFKTPMECTLVSPTWFPTDAGRSNRAVTPRCSRSPPRIFGYTDEDNDVATDLRIDAQQVAAF